MESQLSFDSNYIGDGIEGDGYHVNNPGSNEKMLKDVIQQEYDWTKRNSMTTETHDAGRRRTTRRLSSHFAGRNSRMSRSGRGSILNGRTSMQRKNSIKGPRSTRHSVFSVAGRMSTF